MRKSALLWVVSLVAVAAVGVTAQGGFTPRITPFDQSIQPSPQPRLFPPQVVPGLDPFWWTD